MSLNKLTYALLSFIAAIAILWFGKTILTPIVGAFLMWFIIKEILFYIDKIKIGKRSIPKFVQITMVFLLIFVMFFGVGTLLGNNIENIQENLPEYQQNLNDFIANFELFKRYNFNDFFIKNIQKLDFGTIISTTLNSMSNVFSTVILVVLYLVFILLEMSTFKAKIEKIYPLQEEKSKADNILSSIDASLSQYISLKTFTSFLTGFLSFIALKIIGVDFAFFWAFLIFILNFIPNIGSMVATAFPALMALVQFGDITMPLVVLAAVGAIQLLVGNFLEPKLMGDSLNVSPLVVLISLVFWGWLWGIFGMIMSVPITNMIIIVCAQFEATQWISILLSSDGNLPKPRKRE